MWCSVSSALRRIFRVNLYARIGGRLQTYPLHGKSRDLHSFDFRMLYKFDNMRVARVRNRSFGEEFSIEIFTSIDVTLDLVRTWLSKKGLVVDRAILGHSLHRKEKYVPGIFLMS